MFNVHVYCIRARNAPQIQRSREREEGATLPNNIAKGRDDDRVKFTCVYVAFVT